DHIHPRARRPALRGRHAHRHGTEVRGAPRRDAPAPGVLLLRLRPRRPAAAHPTRLGEEDVAGGVDQQLLRPPRPGRVRRRRRRAPGRAGAGGAGDRAGARAARLPLPRGDGRRDGGERDLPRVRRALRRPGDPRAGRRRGGRARVGRLDVVPRRRPARSPRREPVVRRAGRGDARPAAATPPGL
ncbi:MAG: Isopentenyl-diphosphate Delta-isomerase, partial [uncultured Nocardioides sp.]